MCKEDVQQTLPSFFLQIHRNTNLFKLSIAMRKQSELTRSSSNAIVNKRRTGKSQGRKNPQVFKTRLIIPIMTRVKKASSIIIFSFEEKIIKEFLIFHNLKSLEENCERTIDF